VVPAHRLGYRNFRVDAGFVAISAGSDPQIVLPNLRDCDTGQRNDQQSQRQSFHRKSFKIDERDTSIAL
jgi:hypothetical protein